MFLVATRWYLCQFFSGGVLCNSGEVGADLGGHPEIQCSDKVLLFSASRQQGQPLQFPALGRQHLSGEGDATLGVTLLSGQEL